MRLEALRQGVRRNKTLSNLRRGLVWSALRLAPTKRICVVHGVPDEEEMSILFAIAFAHEFHGRTVLWCSDRAAMSHRIRRYTEMLNLDSEDALEISARGGIRNFLDYLQSEYVCYTHGLYGSPKPPSRKTHINLWHGIGPKRSVDGGAQHKVGAGILVCTAPVWGRETARSLGMPSSVRIIPGNPREQMLKNPATEAQLVALGIEPDSPWVIWLPTYRHRPSTVDLSHMARSSLSLPLHEQWLPRKVLDHLGRLGIQVMVKPHPFDFETWKTSSSESVITNQDLDIHGVGLYSLIAAANGMISDYSSVWVDYLKLNSPIALVCPDVEDYANKRGLKTPDFRDLAADLMVTDEGTIEHFAQRVLLQNQGAGIDDHSLIIEKLGGKTGLSNVGDLITDLLSTRDPGQGEVALRSHDLTEQ